MRDFEWDAVTRILMAAILTAILVGSTIETPFEERPNFGQPGQVVDDSARDDLVRFEDGSWSDGYCEAGALCDDSAVTR